MEWVDVDREAVRGKQEFEGLDPYATWSLSEAGQSHLFRVDAVRTDQGPYEFQVLIELKDPSRISARDLADGTKLLGADPGVLERWRASISIPRAYTHLPAELQQIKHITAIVTDGFLDLLAGPSGDRLRDALARVTLSRPVPREAMRDRNVAAQPASSARAAAAAPPKVLVGIIDDGLAFGHERVRNANGTSRVESIWLQDGEPGSSAHFDYGREIRKQGPQGIDALLAASRPHGVIDDDDFYRRAGAVDYRRAGHKPLAWRQAHGTHVLDLTAGAKPGTEPNWPIVCVQLPVATTADTSGATLAVKVIDGIWYILLRSLEIAGRPIPVAINLSYGTIAGPHDGTSHLESAIDSLTELWEQAFGVRAQIVMSSGNSHLGRVHARIDQSVLQAAKDHCVELPWRIQPDDRTPSYVEVWLPHRGRKFPSPVELSVVTPGGLESPIVARNNLAGCKLVDANSVLCQVSYEYASPPTGRGVFLIAVGPSAALEPGSDPVAPFGIWRLRIKDVGLAQGEHVNAWIQRDDTPYGYPTVGRQSYFDDARYVRFGEAGRELETDDNASVVRRAGSLNAIATGERTVVIGGVMRREERPAKYSAGGPVEPKYGSTQAGRNGPEALSVSDDSKVLWGTLAAGTRSGSVVAMDGTSVAAPLVTRWIAEQLAAGGKGDRDAVQQLAAQPGTPTQPLDPRLGAGNIVDLLPRHQLRVADF